MRFNISNKGANTTTNYEGATAFAMTPQIELYATVATTALSDKFYEGTDERVERIRNLIQICPPEFVAKLAIYAREKMYLRSIPLVLVVELAKWHNGDNLISKTIPKVVKRADEITELLAYYTLANNRKDLKKLNKLSKQVQKGLATVFNSFDEYQFSKYNRDGAIKLRDALFLVHPKPKNAEQQAIFDKITNATLSTAYTWETQLSAVGQRAFTNEKEKEEAKKVKWEELIDSGKMGYMAMLRNLRNFLEADISIPHLMKVCQRLSDAQQVARSKQLPFRFLAAYRELSGTKRGVIQKIKDLFNGKTPLVLSALENAATHAAQNIKGFDITTKVLIAMDVSGSMQQPVSPRSKILNYDIGLMMGMLLKSKCENVVTGMFGDTWKIVNLPQKKYFE